MSAVLNKVKLGIGQRRIRAREFFSDFDGLRRGEVSEAQFKRVLSMMNIYLSMEEMDAIASYFSSSPGQVNYRAFLAEVDSIFIMEGQSSPVRAAETQINESRLAVTEASMIREALLEFGRQIVNKRLLIKPQFQDFDRANTGHVTRTQFTRVLTSNNLLNDESTLPLLCRLYEDSHLGINYREFCSDLEQLEGETGLVSGPLVSYDENKPLPRDLKRQTYFYEMALARQADPHNIEERVKAEVSMKKIRASEFFRDFDGLRKGTVKQGQFRSAIGMMNLKLSSQDIDALVDRYLDTLGDVRYADFCRFVEEAPELLDKMPEYRIPGKAGRTVYLDPNNALNDREEAELEDALIRLGHLVKTRRALIKPFFQDKDKQNSGWVTTTRFRSVLTFAGLPIDDKEFQVLSKRFSNQMGEVNYFEFCKVIAHYSGDDQPF